MVGLSTSKKTSGPRAKHESIITSKLGSSLAFINQYTKHFLTNDLNTTIQLVQDYQLASTSSANLGKLQELFQELYYLLGAGNNETKTFLNISIGKIKDILAKVKDIAPAAAANTVNTSVNTSVNAQINAIEYISTSLDNFISLYLVLIIYSRVSDLLVDKTVALNENLMYWDTLDNSTLSKWMYLLQVLPAKVYSLGHTIWDDSKEKLFTTVSDYDLRYADGLVVERDIESGPSPTEEDNELVHLMVQFHSVFRILWSTTSNTIQKVLDSLSMPNYLFLKMKDTEGGVGGILLNLGVYLRIIVGAPLRSIGFEIKSNRTRIAENIDSIAYSLGGLIQKLPGKQFNHLEVIDEFIKTGNNGDIEAIIERIEAIFEISHSSVSGGSSQGEFNSRLFNLRLFNICTAIESYKDETVGSPPSFLTRNWPLLLIIGRFGPSLTSDFYHNRDEIVEWIRVNLVETVNGFFKDWLIKPITDMLSVIRHDDSSTELSITTRESLQSDLDSLERMVIDYTLDYTDSKQELADLQREIHHAVKEGNLTLLMSKYEQDIRTPFKSTIKGLLPRGLLIQLQKTKVDGAVAINGIDKLLKSQQLVFGMVSVSPSIFILYQVYQMSKNYLNKPIIFNGNQVNLICLKCLNNIDKFLNIYKEVDVEQQIYIEGFILIEILNLKRQSFKILPKSIYKMWIKDLNDVNDDEWSIEGRIRIMSRIWSVYGHYFK